MRKRRRELGRKRVCLLSARGRRERREMKETIPLFFSRRNRGRKKKAQSLAGFYYLYLIMPAGRNAFLLVV